MVTHTIPIPFTRQAGMSFFELILALALSSLIMGLSLPVYQRWVDRHRVRVTVHRFVTALRFARHEAIRRGERITFCPRGDPSHCGEAWAVGQLIVNDHQKILRIYAPVPPGLGVQWQGFSKGPQIVFTPYGISDLSTNGRFIYTLGAVKQTLVISKTGRLKILA